jgi:hypothetical protein
MVDRRRASLVLAALLGAGACATTRPLRPVGRGKTVYSASVGGPMVHALDLVLPAPILMVGGARGVRDDLEAAAALDVTAAVYGNLHLAPGAVWHPLVRPDGRVPSLMAAGWVDVITNFRDGVLVAPRLTGAASWRLRGRHLVYAGADVALAFGSATRLVAGPLAGGELRFGRVGLGLELKWLAPNYDVEPAAPDWISPGSHGFFSVLLGFSYYPGGPP